MLTLVIPRIPVGYASDIIDQRFTFRGEDACHQNWQYVLGIRIHIVCMFVLSMYLVVSVYLLYVFS